MWEFFVGISLASFFAAFFLKTKNTGQKKQQEVIYAPANEIMKYETQKTKTIKIHEHPENVLNEDDLKETSENIINRRFSGHYSENAVENNPIGESWDVPVNARHKESGVFEESGSSINVKAPQNRPVHIEKDDDDKKQAKFSALRFFDS